MNDGGPAMAALIWLAAIVILFVAALRRRRGRFRRVGASATGAVYDWLNEEKRRAVEIIVEKRAEVRDEEDREGNLPELEDPKSHP